MATSPWTVRVLHRLQKNVNYCNVPALTSLSKHGLTQTRNLSTTGPPSGSSNDVARPAPQKVEKPSPKAVTISRAMRSYMEKVKAHDNMMQAESADYEIGKRHLANIMGEDPDNFTQEDVDRAIEYLLPSGLFDKRARPMMKDPYEIFPKRKAAQFGLDGRPYHWMYFTTLPNYYSTLYDINWKLESLKELEDKLRAENKLEEHLKATTFSSSEWFSLQALKEKLVENIREKEYNHFIVLMERLASHPLAHTEEEFIMKFRVLLKSDSQQAEIPKVEIDAEGRSFATATGRRKDANAVVKVYHPGTGQININGQDLRYFSSSLHRETLLFPLIVADMKNQVDLEADVELGGPTGQVGAIRIALAKALTAFVDENVREKLRLSGMLTIDPRKKERKKPGQENARKKFTWKKR